jgi:hypothetical protein
MRTQARYQRVARCAPTQGDIAVADTRNGGDTHGIPESVTAFLGSHTRNSREVPLSCTSALNVLKRGQQWIDAHTQGHFGIVSSWVSWCVSGSASPRRAW